ncbi:MAG: acetamidase/formamidase [Candidatus Poriferisodalaceae bacterium]|jgi:acetamidase/formamidase
MAEHHLTCSPASAHWGYFDAEIPPVLHIRPGDTVRIDTVSGGPGELPKDVSRVLPEHLDIHEALEPDLGPHILTGPIHLDGAVPGDTVTLEILDIECRTDWGWSVQKPGLGALPDDFPEPRLTHFDIDRDNQVATMPWGQELALQPFFGILAVAPARELGRMSSRPPDVFGGNMDNKELGVGTVVYLPVFNDGALISVGDGHGRQGDGEVCLTALETSLTGTFRIGLQTGTGLGSPRAITPTHRITHGFDPDLNLAAQIALREMIGWITAASALPAPDAYTLCSLACDLHVTQVVDGNKGIHAMLPNDVWDTMPRER